MQHLTIGKPGNVDGQLICAAARTLGISRLAELLVVFEARIEWLAATLVALPDNPACVLATLHQSRGSAATLGFTDLERVLADVEMRLSAGPDDAACRLPTQMVRAVRTAWQASLTATVSHVPDLCRHLPFGSKT